MLSYAQSFRVIPPARRNSARRLRLLQARRVATSTTAIVCVIRVLKSESQNPSLPVRGALGQRGRQAFRASAVGLQAGAA
jgi:hypothetical protein